MQMNNITVNLPGSPPQAWGERWGVEGKGKIFTVWHEIFAGSNFREICGFSNDLRKLDPENLLHLFRLQNFN